MNFKLLLITWTLIILTGCNDHYSVNYLVLHPTILDHELDSCNNIPGDVLQSPRCKVAQEAKAIVIHYLRMQQSNPLEFGQQVMDAEIAYIKAKETYSKATGDQLLIAKKALHNAHYQVKLLLAILSINGPE